MIVSRRTERFMAPGKPDVWWQNLELELFDFAAAAESLGISQEQGMEPRELHQAKTRFQCTGPIPANKGPVDLHPVAQPVDTSGDSLLILEQPACLGQPDKLKPAAEFPNYLNVGASWQSTMIQDKCRVFS